MWSSTCTRLIRTLQTTIYETGISFLQLYTKSYSWSTRVFPFIAVLATFTHGTYIISYKSTIYGKKMRFKCVSRDFRSSIKQERTEQRHTTSEVLFTWIKCVFKDCVLVLKWFYSNALQTWNCVKKVLYHLVKLLPTLMVWNWLQYFTVMVRDITHYFH